RLVTCPCLGAKCASWGPIAQWLEQGTHNPLVLGSSPGGPTSFPLYEPSSPAWPLFAPVHHDRSRRTVSPRNRRTRSWHVAGYLAEALKREDVKLVGVVEPKPALAASFAERFRVPPALMFSSLEAMLVSAKPEAVMVFTSTFEHRQVVETCAPHGVHVMMEKPL